MSLSDRAIAARTRAGWWALVGAVALRQGLAWALVAGTAIFLLSATSQISLRDTDQTFAHLRASWTVSSGQANAAMTVRDSFARPHQMTAFQVVTHPAVHAAAERTTRRLKLYSAFAAMGAAVAFCLGGYSVIRGARR